MKEAIKLVGNGLMLSRKEPSGGGGPDGSRRQRSCGGRRTDRWRSA